jgi:NAD(P)-dependent dehydrogenase (short-subunit alcohol dehydrogenase family)
MDLNDLNSVRAAALEFMSLESKLDVLVHNAGSTQFSVEPQAKTLQGIEAMVGMNCVAPLLLTTLLLPLLRVALQNSRRGTVRVIWTASIAAEFSTPTNGIDFSKLDTGVSDTTMNYGVSKLGNWVLARECARRFGKEGIASVAHNPGNVDAGSYDALPPVTRFLMKRLVLSKTKLGAYTELYASLAPEVGEEKWNGAYILPFGRLRDDEKCHRDDILHAMNPLEDGGLGYGQKFWEWCEQKVQEYL